MNEDLKRKKHFTHLTDEDGNVQSIWLYFTVSTDDGAVYLWVNTGWLQGDPEPFPAGVGLHSPTPLYEGHKQETEPCNFISNEYCYLSDHGVHEARRLWGEFLTGGTELLWQRLEEYYHEVFDVVLTGREPGLSEEVK